MQFGGVGPGGETGETVELSQETAHQLVGPVLLAQRFDAGQDSRDGGVGLGDGALRVILALPRESLTMLEKFLTVEVGQQADRGARNPDGADACHATPRGGHL